VACLHYKATESTWLRIRSTKGYKAVCKVLKIRIQSSHFLRLVGVLESFFPQYHWLVMTYLNRMCMLALWLIHHGSFFASAGTIPGPESRDINSTATVLGHSVQAGISETLAHSFAIALEFEKAKWANGSVDDDDFYSVPRNASLAPVGALLKVQVDSNTSAYTLPPNTALSRIMYQTETLNGSKIPASAYVLWPYSPRTHPDGYPVIGWAHGASGGFGNCAPSHVKDLWYQSEAPYTLALQGYVVVAPDYAGLGVNKDAEGKPILHPHLAFQAHANDLVNAVHAAQTAFRDLSKHFVLMGHSQGGGVAWGAAQRQVLRPVDGYLGTVAISPITRIVDQVEISGAALNEAIVLLANAIPAIFPKFRISDILTPAGVKRLNLLSEVQGCNSPAFELFSEPGLFQPDWPKNRYVQAFQSLTANGDHPIAGPMFVIQGEADNLVSVQLTTEAVDKVCKDFPRSQLEYVTLANATHVPAVYASQRQWLAWIEDRFANKVAAQGCRRSRFASPRPYQFYQEEENWYIKAATQVYEIE
jgi:alpha-beta hydrolase superfamily lysophospholipase